jgi:hypothetical protein
MSLRRSLAVVQEQARGNYHVLQSAEPTRSLQIRRKKVETKSVLKGAETFT